MDRNSLTDLELVHLTIDKRDETAFGILYSRYKIRVFSKCISFTKSKEEAEDLCHDIFIKVLLKLSTYKEKASFHSWIYAITYNSCVDFVQKKYKVEVNTLEFEEIDESRIRVFHSDIENVLLKLKVEHLKEVLNHLKPEDKMILLLKYQDDLSIAELQEVFDKGESAIKMKLLRAKERAIEIHKSLYEEELI